MTRLNGGGPPDPLDELNDVIAELEGSEWDDEEITAEHILEAVKVGAAAASGKHQAMSKDQAEEITKTDHGVTPKPESVPPKAKFALAVLDRIQPPWLRAPVVLAALALVGLMLWRGVALTGLLP